MTLQELLHDKYLEKIHNISQKEWEEIIHIAKFEHKNISEIIYRAIYFTYEDYKNLDRNDEFFKSLTDARNNHYIKECRVKYSYDRYFLTQKGLKAYNVI